MSVRSGESLHGAAGTVMSWEGWSGSYTVVGGHRQGVLPALQAMQSTLRGPTSQHLKVLHLHYINFINYDVLLTER